MTVSLRPCCSLRMVLTQCASRRVDQQHASLFLSWEATDMPNSATRRAESLQICVIALIARPLLSPPYFHGSRRAELERKSAPKEYSVAGARYARAGHVRREEAGGMHALYSRCH